MSLRRRPESIPLCRRARTRRWHCASAGAPRWRSAARPARPHAPALPLAWRLRNTRWPVSGPGCSELSAPRRALWPPSLGSWASASSPSLWARSRRRCGRRWCCSTTSRSICSLGGTTRTCRTRVLARRRRRGRIGGRSECRRPHVTRTCSSRGASRRRAASLTTSMRGIVPRWGQPRRRAGHAAGCTVSRGSGRSGVRSSRRAESSTSRLRRLFLTALRTPSLRTCVLSTRRRRLATHPTRRRRSCGSTGCACTPPSGTAATGRLTTRRCWRWRRICCPHIRRRQGPSRSSSPASRRATGHGARRMLAPVRAGTWELLRFPSSPPPAAAWISAVALNRASSPASAGPTCRWPSRRRRAAMRRRRSIILSTSPRARR